jgi:hypothetical protein
LSLSPNLLSQRRRVGSSIWEYLWLLSHVTTKESDGNGGFVGIVADGKSIPTSRIAKDLQRARATSLANLERLEAGNYIMRMGAPGHAYRYRVPIR